MIDMDDFFIVFHSSGTTSNFFNCIYDPTMQLMTYIVIYMLDYLHIQTMYLFDLSFYLSMIQNTITRATRDVDNAQNCIFENLKNHKKNAMIWIVNFCVGIGPNYL
jgi:hypothetical protein